MKVIILQVEWQDTDTKIFRVYSGTKTFKNEMIILNIFRHDRLKLEDLNMPHAPWGHWQCQQRRKKTEIRNFNSQNFRIANHLLDLSPVASLYRQEKRRNGLFQVA